MTPAEPVELHLLCLSSSLSPRRKTLTYPPKGSFCKMENALLLCIFLSHWHFLNALFTVEVPQPQYIVEYGSNVTMECRFRVNGELKLQELSVIWEKKEEHTKEVYKLHKGKENLNNQHSNYRGRVNLLKEKLQLGQSMLQITNVKPTDAGTYLCLIGYEGADYKTITLQVKAPYRNITKRTVTVQGTAGHSEWELICQSEGYPKAEVIWHNGEHQDFSAKANTTYEAGTDQLYSVTSTLKTNTSVNETFHCVFWNKEFKENTSAILIIPDCPVGSRRINGRHYFATAGAVLVLFGSSLLFMLWVKKARKDQDREMGTNYAAVKVIKLSTDEEEGDCRGISPENEELENVRIEVT
ncbi:programmed cell death 1 ligand 1 isoform X1 [Chelonoidis abingdonii]|uniref:programmed cell death 1 ligand 1 isoform X1 n=1 Tax=Chelonoidis abingdonii TaxID=106734 RepID=UPI0013F184A8|nr:programmed cell death 1 ligand 1 isoform X1 [Chelonoidis abingdonii]